MNQKGFTLIELLFAIALSALFLPALVFVYSFSLGAASQGENYTQAYALAQEYMEAIYYIKKNSPNEWDWISKPENTLDGEYYQPYKSGGVWVLGPKNPPPQEINGYNVFVEIKEIRRNEQGDIDEAGNIDHKSRKIIITVKWKEKGNDTSIDLVSYVTKH